MGGICRLELTIRLLECLKCVDCYCRRNRYGIYPGDGKVTHDVGSEKEKQVPLVKEADMASFLKGGK